MLFFQGRGASTSRTGKAFEYPFRERLAALLVTGGSERRNSIVSHNVTFATLIKALR